MSEYSGWAFDEHQMRAYALAARADLVARLELCDKGVRERDVTIWQRDGRIRELETAVSAHGTAEYYRDLQDKAQRAEAAEARVRELQADLVCAFDAIGTAGVDGPLNLIDAAEELRQERDALRARLEAIQKQPTIAWRYERTDPSDKYDLWEFCDYRPMPGTIAHDFHRARNILELIERPELL